MPPPRRPASLDAALANARYLLIPLAAVLFALGPVQDAVLRALRLEPVFVSRFAKSPFASKATEGCRVDTRVGGCEDMVLHEPSGSVFMACGSPKARMEWFPAITAYGTKHPDRAGLPEDRVYKYDLRTGSLIPLAPANCPDSPCLLRLHGMGLFPDQQAAGLVWIHLVNHLPGGSCVDIFSHVVGSETMKFEKRVCDPLINTPNDVEPVSPKSFYVTNDHVFKARTLVGVALRLVMGDAGNALWPSWLRQIEDKLGSQRLTDVVFCEDGKCRVAAKDIIRANGILSSPDGKTVMVDSSRSGTVVMYKRNATTNELTRSGDLSLGAACDNLSYDPTADRYYVAVFPDIHALGAHFANPLDKKHNAPSGVVSFAYNPEGGIDWDLAYYDRGTLVGDVTVAVSSAKLGKSILGTVLSDGIVVCDHAL